jgi:hypothetical protein
MVFFKKTQKIGWLRLCQSLSTLCKFVNALLMFFFQCTQQRPTLTMSEFVYVLYICTYWWWSSFQSLLSAKDRLTLTLSKSLYLLLQWWWSSFNLTFQSIYLSFYTQHRQTLTMSMSVYVLYICTYWWWSSFHLYYQQKTDWHWHCQSHSTFCYTGDGLLSTFLSFPSVTSPP